MFKRGEKKIIMALHKVQGNDGMDLLTLGCVNASSEGKNLAQDCTFFTKKINK
jgi:hypothetical protein